MNYHIKMNSRLKTSAKHCLILREGNNSQFYYAWRHVLLGFKVYHYVLVQFRKAFINSRSDFLVMRDQMPFNRNLGPLIIYEQTFTK